MKDSDTIICDQWEIIKQNLTRLSYESYIDDQMEIDEYGCYDATWNLANALCKNWEDDLYFADCLWKNNRFFRKDAAEIYFRHGREDRYIEYLMGSLTGLIRKPQK